MPSNFIFELQANHTFQDIGKFYTIPAADKLHYFQLGGLSNNFKTLWQIFNENAVMIRRPAVEIIECMEKANYDKLPVKYAIRILFLIVIRIGSSWNGSIRC